MTRLKIVPFATPNADGEWIESPVEVPSRTGWRRMEMIVAPFIPADHFVVAIECGSRSRAPAVTGVVPFKTPQ